MHKENIKNLSLEELQQYLLLQGEKTYRAKQIFSWLYKKNIHDFRQMSNLSLELRGKLRAVFVIDEAKLIDKKTSKTDHTSKFLFKLEDGNFIESVLIPNPDRLTACLSTQVGCRFRCGFCASGREGFIRNLEPQEIINQLQFINRDIRPPKKETRLELSNGVNLFRNKKLLKDKVTSGVYTRGVSNVVFMGMGEPLDNYRNLMKAIRIINHALAFNIGARKITISTCGLPRCIEKLSKEDIQVELSVSLHAADNKLRTELMPINKKHPIEELIAVCRKYTADTNRVITFEYLLINTLNDRQSDLKKIVKLFKGFKCKINLIVCNPFKEREFLSTPIEKAVEFQKKLKAAGIFTTLRQSKGRDIEAACGQLRLKIVKDGCF